jgi:hypothetical protein
MSIWCLVDIKKTRPSIQTIDYSVLHSSIIDMKRSIIQARNFSKSIDALVKKRQLLAEDFNDFKAELAINPLLGDLVPGTGGIRKVRLGSTSKGKSGGFRICYYYLVSNEQIYLLLIYAKSEQENLTSDEKKALKELVTILKGSKK